MHAGPERQAKRSVSDRDWSVRIENARIGAEYARIAVGRGEIDDHAVALATSRPLSATGHTALRHATGLAGWRRRLS